MEILGYSERGFFNTLFFSLYHHEDAAELISSLIGKARWPSRGPGPQEFGTCDLVFTEQSFSDFGDADTVLRFVNGDVRHAIFLEGKRGDLRVQREWQKFTNACRTGGGYKGLTSNVFCQLYFKQRMMHALAQGGIALLQEGLDFPRPLQRNQRDPRRKIGRNPVVLDAVNRLAPCGQHASFLMIVPEDDAAVNAAWATFLDAGFVLNGWSLQECGFLSLRNVDQFCREKNLADVIRVLDYNKGQLFK
jgi:hypothetical protein